MMLEHLSRALLLEQNSFKSLSGEEAFQGEKP